MVNEYITPDDFTGTDTQKVQAALNARGSIRLNRAYSINSTLTIYGDTQLIGYPNAKLTWIGSASGSILQDSSLVTSTDVNENIVLENFEIDGQADSNTASTQLAINFYRTGNVTIRALTVRNVGGSGIRWGLSQTDTENVLVENCLIYGCFHGDAIQGSGNNIVIRNNTVGIDNSATTNFGDTGIALLTDFSTTNPSPMKYPNDIEISGNTVIGNHNGSQTGIAFGPFEVGAQAAIRVVGNIVRKCYVNLWAIVMDDVLISNNDFRPHSATATGNIRVDGITNIRILDNNIAIDRAGTGLDYAGILLNSQRNVYGASRFDADVSKADIRGNIITSSAGGTGIRATFAQINNSPTYISRLTKSRFDSNIFLGLETPISLAPQTGDSADTCNDVVISNNKSDSTANSVVAVAGNPNQFVGVQLLDNPVVGATPAFLGTGSDDLLIRHRVFAKISASSGVPTTALTLPATGYFQVDVNAFVKAANSSFSAVATITVNGGSARITNQSDGSNLKITISGINVQLNQTTGDTNEIRVTATYY